MATNLWRKDQMVARQAYCRHSGTPTVGVVARFLGMYLPPEPQHVVDVGGGDGSFALTLARAGHFVTVLDSDKEMLALAEDRLCLESSDVASRVKLVLGDGERLTTLLGAEFGLVCCHSVLMYLGDPQSLIRALIASAEKGGVVSVLSINPVAIAMRSGLQGRWKETAASLESGRYRDPHSMHTYLYPREQVCRMLEAEGAKVLEWQGVGVFTDHLQVEFLPEDRDDVEYVEFLASMRDPYRQVARCFHIVARRD